MDDTGDPKNKKIDKEKISLFQRYLTDVGDVSSPLWIRRPLQIDNGSKWFILGCRYNFLFNFRMFLVILYLSYEFLK